MELLGKWLGKEEGNLKLKLLYRATTDSFTSKAFHLHHGSAYPTLIIVKSEFDEIFGGYTTVPWNTDKESPKKDPGVLLFSLTKGFVIPA